MTAAYRSSLGTSFYYTTNPLSLAKPSGVVEGDVLLAVMLNNDSTRSLDTLPSGWTLLHNTAAALPTSAEMWVVWKKAGASEPASYDFTFNYGFNGAAQIVAFRDGNTININGAAAVSAVDSASPYTSTAPSITTTENDCLLIAINGCRVTTQATPSFTVPSGYTSRIEAKSEYDERMFAVSDKTLASAGASGTAAGEWSITGGGDARTTAVHLAISPAAAAYVARPASDISAGTWSPSTGSDLFAMIDEAVADDGDYISASAAGTSEVKFGTLSAPPTGWITKIKFRTEGSITVSLRMGSTEIASWAKTGAKTTYEEELSSGQQASITDWTDLRLRYVKA